MSEQTKQERVLHCWADQFPTDKLDFGSPEWIQMWVEKEKWLAEHDTTGVCLLPDGHEGPHEFVAWDELTFDFAGEEAEG